MQGIFNNDIDLTNWHNLRRNAPVIFEIVIPQQENQIGNNFDFYQRVYFNSPQISGDPIFYINFFLDNNVVDINILNNTVNSILQSLNFPVNYQISQQDRNEISASLQQLHYIYHNNVQGRNDWSEIISQMRVDLTQLVLIIAEVALQIQQPNISLILGGLLGFYRRMSEQLYHDIMRRQRRLLDTNVNYLLNLPVTYQNLVNAISEFQLQEQDNKVIEVRQKIPFHMRDRMIVSIDVLNNHPDILPQNNENIGNMQFYMRRHIERLMNVIRPHLPPLINHDNVQEYISRIQFYVVVNVINHNSNIERYITIPLNFITDTDYQHFIYEETFTVDKLNYDNADIFFNVLENVMDQMIQVNYQELLFEVDKKQNTYMIQSFKYFIFYRNYNQVTQFENNLLAFDFNTDMNKDLNYTQLQSFVVFSPKIQNWFCLYEIYLFLMQPDILKQFYNNQEFNQELLDQYTMIVFQLWRFDQNVELKNICQKGNVCKFIENITSFNKNQYNNLIKFFNIWNRFKSFRKDSQIISFPLIIYLYFENEIYPKDILMSQYLKQCEMKQINVLVIYRTHAFLSNMELVSQLMNTRELKLNIPFILYKHQNKIKKTQKQIEEKVYFFGLDIESIADNQGYQYPYLICLYGQDQQKYHFWGQQCQYYFIQWIQQFKQNIIGESNNKLEIFAFNGSRYDYILLFKQLYLHFQNTILIGELTNIKGIIIDNQIFFKDIKLLFPIRGRLKDIAQKILKSPDLQKNELDIKLYKTIHEYEQNKQKIIEYCFQDARIVYELLMVLQKMCESFKIKFKWHEMTMAKLSLNIFKSNFWPFQQNKWESLPNLDIQLICRDSYFGGMCSHIFKYGQNLIQYDINSSYPAIMKQLIPYKLKEIQQNRDKQYIFIEDSRCIHNISQVESFINKFSLYRIHFKFKDSVIIPNLPIRSFQHNCLAYVLNNLDIPIGNWYWGVELLQHIQHQRFEFLFIHDEIMWECGFIFKDFIQYMYDKRLEAKQNKEDEYVEFYKLLMNSLSGKYGQREFGEMNILKQHQLIEVSSSRVKHIQDLEDGIYRLQFFDKFSLNHIGNFTHVISFITAAGRANLMNGILDVGEQNVYYFDTDSIFTSKPLSESLIDNNQLGKWKIEHYIKEVQFYGKKCYVYIDDKDNKTLKCKGIPSQELKDKKLFEQLEQNGYAYDNGSTYFLKSFDNVQVTTREKFVVEDQGKRIWNGNNSLPYKNISDFDIQYKQFLKSKNEIHKQFIYRNKIQQNLQQINNMQIKDLTDEDYSVICNEIIQEFDF